MSHFVGIVFGSNVDELLAPYDEGLEVDPYVNMTYNELLDHTEERIENYREYIEKNKDSDNEYTQRSVKSMQEILDKYNDFRTVKDYNLYISKRYTLDKDRNSITTYNPNSKWDWYSIGGRWSGEILHAGSYDTDQAHLEDITKIDTPYCFVDLNGNWHEKGEMGWWGMASNEKEEDIWEKEFREYLNSIPKNTLLTVIDFHI